MQQEKWNAWYNKISITFGLVVKYPSFSLLFHKQQ